MISDLDKFKYRSFCMQELYAGNINYLKYQNMLKSEQTVLKINGYLESLDLDSKSRELILDLLKGYDYRNLIIAEEILNTLSKTVKEKQ